MGNFIKKQVSPGKRTLQLQRPERLQECNGSVSRANFKFINILDTYGLQNESILWLACNINNQSQKYFVRQIDKYKVYDHKRIEPTLNQLQLLTNHNNPYLIKVNFAFQDYESLYLVSKAIQSQSLQSIMDYHQFTQDQTRYIVLALISVIQYVHSKGFAITDLSPKDIHINKANGSLKIIRISNPSLIDSSFYSNAVQEICPYSAPEILLRNHVLAECDFYSLGLIVYELMTQTKVFADNVNSRSHILSENIEIKKYKIPEDWKADVADFLIKLLIKNPALRLGRYGSYEVKNHSWLNEFDMDQGYMKGIAKYQSNAQNAKSYKQVKQIFKKENKMKDDCINNHFFQQLFQTYNYQQVYRKSQHEQKKSQEQMEAFEEKTSIYFNESAIAIRKSTF